MGVFEALLLGIVQGLTEFLPISSTAHLRIVPALLGWPDPGTAFTAVTQMGTLGSVLLYFRKEVTRYTVALLKSLYTRRPFETDDSRMAWWILFGTIPIAVLGLLFKNMIETGFRSLYVISGSLILLALLLVVAERSSKFNRRIQSMNLGDTQIIGLAQALALIPGSSRSGTTITAGMFLNLDRETAATFSFLLSIPAVGLSGLYQLYKIWGSPGAEMGVSLLIAVIVSGIVGYLSIGFLLRYLRSHSTYLFVGYRIALGVLILILLSTGILEPM